MSSVLVMSLPVDAAVRMPGERGPDSAARGAELAEVVGDCGDAPAVLHHGPQRRAVAEVAVVVVVEIGREQQVVGMANGQIARRAAE